jgi:putative transposase
LAGVTFHPDPEWMEQMTRNVTMEDCGFLINRKYLLHDRDSKYCSSFRQMIEAGSVKTLTGQKSESERLCGTLGKVG